MSEVEAAKQTAPSVGFEADNNQSLSDYMKGYLRRMKSGDMGSLPIILGLVILVVIFQMQNENFLTARNFVSLIL